MAASINHVTLLGNVGGDPQVSDIGQGRKAAQISLATTNQYKDSSGEWKEQTEWHNLVAFGPHATVVEKYVRKGSQIAVEGRLRTRNYTTKEGEKRYVTEIVITNLQLLGSRSQERQQVSQNLEGARQLQQNQQRPATGQSAGLAPGEDLPADDAAF